MTNITILKKVVEQALAALCDTETPAYRPQYGVESLAVYDLRCALDQCEAEDPAQYVWAKTVRIAKVALHEMPRPHTDWMEAAKAVCESVVKVGHCQEHEQGLDHQQKSSCDKDLSHETGQLITGCSITPEGWKLVPVEPTQEMEQVCMWATQREDIWDAMLAAAPQPPTAEQSSEAEQDESACQEPVAWVNQSVLEWPLRQSEKVAKLTRKAQPEYGFVIPIYTNPQPPRQPLTRKKVQELVIEVCDTLYPQGESTYSEADSVFYTALVRAVERTHHINHEGEEA